MGIRKWLSRKLGSYSMNLAVAESVIKEVLDDPKLLKRIDSKELDWKTVDEIVKRTFERRKITDPEFHEAFMEKWEEYKKRIYQYEFDRKREKYT